MQQNDSQNFNLNSNVNSRKNVVFKTTLSHVKEKYQKYILQHKNTSAISERTKIMQIL